MDFSGCRSRNLRNAVASSENRTSTGALSARSSHSPILSHERTVTAPQRL
jgi:hypothetical protein